MPSAIIDDKEVSFAPGETILTAATRAGIYIPTLCYSPDLRPEGGCRLCLVEVGGREKPVGSCHTPLQAGMQILTATEKLKRLRHDVLALYSGQVELSQTSGLAAGKLEKLAREHQVELSHNSMTCRDESHPYLRFDSASCITCRLCLNACEQIQGQFVYSVGGRGPSSHLLFGPGGNFADSECVSCGACVDHCPTGAISDRDRVGSVQTGSKVESVCGYCGVGCRISIESIDGRVIRIDGVKDAAVNRGHLCVKGRYAHAYQHSPDRLTKPLLRKNGELVPVSYDEAYSFVADRLEKIVTRFGSSAVGALSSSRSTNEAAYLLQKLYRVRLGTNNVDCCARVCHSSTALGLQLLTGTGAATASFADIEKAKCIVVAGANATEAHPVVGARIKQAVLDGAKLVVIDPRCVELAEYADVFLQLTPGTNVPLFNALALLLTERGMIDYDFVNARTEGWEEFADFLGSQSLEELQRVTGVSSVDIQKAAELIGRTGPCLFVSGLGLSELTQGTASVMTYCNLGMITGSIGKPGAGMLPLRGQNNVQGNADMGGMPNQVTGYQRLDDPEVRARLEALWGVAPPELPGLTVPEMIAASERGEIKSLWIQGEDVAQSDPNEHHVRAALSKLELLIVQEMFLSETAKYAHVVFPAAGALEQEGTFTNGERRIQQVRPAVAPPGDAKPDWEVIRDVALKLGLVWEYAVAGEVMDEVALAAPALFGGVSFARLGGDGLQWPCPDKTSKGTGTIHAEAFVRGKGKLVSIDYLPSPEHGVEGYPYLLITGRILEHYNVGTMTRRTPQQELAPEDVLEVNPIDLRKEGLADGERVRLASRWGEIRVPVRASSRIAEGTMFLTFHYPETHANFLTGPSLDPQSKCPQYKAIAVRLSGF